MLGKSRLSVHILLQRNLTPIGPFLFLIRGDSLLGNIVNVGSATVPNGPSSTVFALGRCACDLDLSILRLPPMELK